VAFACFVGASALAASPGSATQRSVVITDATVTSAAQGHDSAVVLKILNATNEPISLLSVKSSSAGADMIFFDANMCRGNHAMTALASIYVARGLTQKLGYQRQGAMLSELRQSLTKGERIALVVTWSDFSSVHHATIEASVVAAPAHIRFLMGNMSM
jgi:copper(I)-binding protein